MLQAYPSRTLGEAVWDWFESRNYWRLLLAVPAFLGVAGVAAFAFYHWSWRAERAEGSCVELGGTAITSGQFQRAALAYQSLIRLRGTDDPDYLFRIARCFGELDRRPEAAAMFSTLAPLDRPGHVPAHLFLARALLSTEAPSPHALGQAEVHLQQVLKQEAQNPDARELLGRIYLTLGRWDEARKQLIEVVAKRPEVALQLAVTQKELGDDAGSRAWAGRAVKTFSAQCEEATGENPRARLSWVNALTLLKDYPQAAAVLDTGRQKASSPLYDEALAQVCGLWATQLRTEQPTNRALRLQVLRQGLEAIPGNAVLLGELLRFVRVKGAEAEATRQALNRLLAGGRDAAWLHFCLGCLAQDSGDPAKAAFHLKTAFNAAPALANIANNLAATLGEARPPDLPLALPLMQAVLARDPENAFYRDTRGQLLLKQGDAQAAVADLEAALPKLPDKTATHRALSAAYTKLGRADLAAEHARQADASAPPRPPPPKLPVPGP
jgi:tetratricopeptide (TPR) repeat protein